MAKYTFNKFQENVASVVKIEALASGTTIEPHTVVSIAAAAVTGTITATVVSGTPAAGDFLVWRRYPDYNIVGDRYGKIAKTPIATSTGELYGFVLKLGDELIAEANGSLVIVAAPAA
ncbi:MAG: hypothetical protein EOM74_02725 [Methanomicrobia archaeon]|nr:hypothetical protein [Methanomicrobia archaeon]